MDRASEAYMSQMEALRAEIGVAVAAISGDDLRGLEESVARQEFLASGLAVSLRRLDREGGATPLPVHVRARILSCMNGLQTSAQAYSALLGHSGRSIAVLASLCRSHVHPGVEVRGARPARQTWSCEV